MKNIKSWVLPIRLFATIVIAQVLTVVTTLVFKLMQLSVGLPGSTNTKLFITLLAIYLMACVYYFFDIHRAYTLRKMNRHLYRQRGEEGFIV